MPSRKSNVISRTTAEKRIVFGRETLTTATAPYRRNPDALDLLDEVELGDTVKPTSIASVTLPRIAIRVESPP